MTENAGTPQDPEEERTAETTSGGNDAEGDLDPGDPRTQPTAGASIQPEGGPGAETTSGGERGESEDPDTLEP